MGTLAEALDYRNEAVIRRFRRTWAVSIEEAEDLFTELKKFLWLSAQSEAGASWRDPTWVPLLDEMWHTFILFTESYAEYCNTRLGRFIHHWPGDGDEEPVVLDDDKRRAEVEADLRTFIGMVYDHLGEETTNHWFHELPQRYSDPILEDIFIRPVSELVGL